MAPIPRLDPVLRDATVLERSDSVAPGQTYLYAPAAGYRQARSGAALFTVSDPSGE